MFNREQEQQDEYQPDADLWWPTAGAGALPVLGDPSVKVFDDAGAVDEINDEVDAFARDRVASADSVNGGVVIEQSGEGVVVAAVHAATACRRSS
ncbi:hypothetical protein [Plantibacter sp. YIM 135249]|uniref:hypothetical protein n=1 Tax=Plantibacter sp. YIM 135249 TaxID=3423918 RepID=UPI003D33FC23